MIASPDCTFCTFGITTPNGDGCPNPICGLSITIAPAVQDEGCLVTATSNGTGDLNGVVEALADVASCRVADRMIETTPGYPIEVDEPKPVESGWIISEGVARELVEVLFGMGIPYQAAI
ncbi:hypothetical protein GcLGCM259_2418 [Glutamicibacter creatinolyticus]|uniref:Uncharacterized protein n=1 Tax=Glutamicibacter creatinolyticus TaxID=162496 RepID=A0A5B7WXP9_9MICC|nr:hypothetical protein [Glutamicibacter creatinolyticus]QCY48125.1 hypothetical protein GcLGCM259_2418 [Glutamicibacter creatinolyticus]